jgi:AcrR family transcriptional regulator
MASRSGLADPGNSRRSGGSRIVQRRHARRLDILRAAGRTFRERGFAATGMREIAAAADISPANLYNYFQGKQELLFFCQDKSLDRMLEALEKARRSRWSAEEKVRSVIESHLRCVLDEVDGSAAHLVTEGVARGMQQRLVAKRDRYERGLCKMVAAGVESGEFAECEPALVVRAVLGALNWTVQWFRPEGSLTPGQIAGEFGRYLTRGLAVRQAELTGRRK